jgi:hypothetical protein
MAESGPQVVPAALVQTYYDTNLQMQVEGEDIFAGYRGEIKGDGSALPNAVIVTKFQKGKRTGNVGLLKSLSVAGLNGRNELSGTSAEEEMTVLSYTCYANEFKKGVKAESFGIDFVADDEYSLLKRGNGLLADFMEKSKGGHRREALIECWSSNLVAAPSSITQHITANFYVGGQTLALQPAYSDTLSTYKAAINTAIPDLADADNQMTPASITELEHWVRNVKRIEPLANGRYILTVPANQKRVLMDPDTGILKHLSQSSKPEMATKGWFGTWGMFDLVEDVRSPMMTADDAGTTIVWSYVSANDSRPVVAADNWDVAFVLGKGAVLEYEVEKMHYQTDTTNEYGRDHRLGAFADYGDQIIQYDNGTDDTLNYGSAVAVFASLV